jgi:hypothetical protein
MTGLVPIIHVVRPPESFGLAGSGAAWMAGTSLAIMETPSKFSGEENPRRF